MLGKKPKKNNKLKNTASQKINKKLLKCQYLIKGPTIDILQWNLQYQILCKCLKEMMKIVGCFLRSLTDIKILQEKKTISQQIGEKIEMLIFQLDKVNMENN